MILVGFVIYGTYIGLKNIIRYNTYRKAYEKTHSEYLFELDRHQQLTHKLLALESPDYWEKRAKMDLGYIKSNEVAIKFIGR